MPSCFSIREVHIGYVGMIQLWIRMTSVTCSMIDGSMPPGFWPVVHPMPILGHIFHFRWDLWIFTYVTCSMIDDFMSPNFWPVIRSMPYWGILPFWMRFTDLGGVVRLFPFTRRTSRRWSIRYLYDDSSVEPLGSYPVRPALLDASMSSCFPSGKRPFDLWVWFSCIHGWLGSRIRWRVIWAHLAFPTYHTFDATLGHIPPFRSRFVDPPSICMIILGFWDTHRVDDSISLCPDTPWSLSWVSQPDSRFLI